jgi:hypothetical protein
LEVGGRSWEVWGLELVRQVSEWRLGKDGEFSPPATPQWRGLGGCDPPGGCGFGGEGLGEVFLGVRPTLQAEPCLAPAAPSDLLGCGDPWGVSVWGGGGCGGGGWVYLGGGILGPAGGMWSVPNVRQGLGAWMLACTSRRRHLAGPLPHQLANGTPLGSSSRNSRSDPLTPPPPC